MPDGTIIFLNGVSSAGKTSIANQLQAQLDQPYMHLATDTFIQMVPPRFWDGSQPE